MASISRITAWAATGLVIAGLFLALILLLTRSAHGPSIEPATSIDVPMQESAPADAGEADAVPAQDVAPPELVATADELQAQYESRKDELPEELSGPLDEEFGVIEGAMANVLAAIAQEPDNDSLKRMLVATYRNEIRLLKKALHLTTQSEPDSEEPE